MITFQEIERLREQAVYVAHDEAIWPNSTAPYELGIAAVKVLAIIDLALEALSDQSE